MFFTADAKKVFTTLKQAFVEAPILNHLDLKHYIPIETDALSYTIGGILSPLTLYNLGRWYLVAFFSRKIFSAETRYKSYDNELLAIVEAFKTWKHYLESCKYEVLMLIDYNNLKRFMDIKNPSSRQVRWAQELSRYHFRIDYQ